MTDRTSMDQVSGSDGDLPPTAADAAAGAGVDGAELAAAPLGGPVTPPPAAPGALVEHGGTSAPVEAPTGTPVAPGATGSTTSSATATSDPAPALERPYIPVLPTIDPVAPGHLDHVSADDAVAPGHIRVQCPNCDSLWEGNDLRPHAEWFCGKCDFPLFWARSGVPSSNEFGGALARLPGTDGRDAILSLACPACGEMNQPVPTANCLRCGHPLTSPEPATVLPAPAVLYLQPEPVARRRIWPWVVATCILAAALAVVIIVAIVN